MCFLEDKPVVPTNDNTEDTKKKLGKWERPNYLNLMIIKGLISNNVRGLCLAVTLLSILLMQLDVSLRNLVRLRIKAL